MIEKILECFLGIPSIIKLFNLERNSEIAIKRKNELYLPLLQALQEMKSDINLKNFEIIKSDFIKNIVEYNYMYSIDERVLKNLKVLLEDLDKYNKINELTIARQIIIDSFKHGFSDLYGSIIDGYSISYDEIHDCEYEFEEIAEEVLYFDVEFDFIIDLLKHRKNLDIYYHYDTDNQLEEFFINHQLVELYETGLNNNRKIQLEEWENEKGEYIAYYYDFNKQYDNHEQIKEKNMYRDKVLNQLDSIIIKTQGIIKKIVKTHEKKGLRY